MRIMIDELQKQETYERGDYRELLNLMEVYLGGVTDYRC